MRRRQDDDWSVHQIARLAGTTSRTLRHYDQLGLLRPTRIGANGYRYYDRDALVLLQRIMMLRQLGLGLPAIARVMDRHEDPRDALESHLRWLREEQDRLARQIASVETTIQSLERGEPMMPEEMFDGFEHTAYKDEVEQRWGVDAYARSDAWWRSKTDEERRAFQQEHADIARDYAGALSAGARPADDVVQAIVARHVAWLNESAQATGGPITAGRLRGYGELYVGDPRFAANYGGQEGAEFVRDALNVFAGRVF
jgi:MerR family transcriptional regulator, thiopeptide resistance regulator